MSEQTPANAGPNEPAPVSLDQPTALPHPSQPEAEPRREPVAQEPKQDAPGEQATQEGQEPKGDGEEPGRETEPAAEETAQPDQEDGQKKPPKVRFHERIKQLNDRAKAAEAERDRAIQQYRELEKSLQQPDGYDEWDDDQQRDFQIRQAVREERAEQVRDQARQAHEQARGARGDAIATKVDAVRERIPDIDIVFRPSSEGGPTITEPMADMIAESDNGAEIAYYLAKNQGESVRIAQLPAHRQGAELARLEQRVKPPENARKTTQTPPPVQTVGGSPGPEVKDPNSMTMPEYAVWRRQQKKEAG